MSDSAELNRILSDLADGTIDADQAARRIADLDRPAERPQVSPESLYDSRPARALADDSADADETAEQSAPASSDDAGRAEDQAAEAPGEPDEASSVDDGSAPDAESPTHETGPAGGPSEHNLFDIQLDDVAAVAGEVFRDAGDIARGAWQRLGEFASSVLPGDIAAAVPEPPHFAPPPGAPRPAAGKAVEKLIVRSVGRRVRIVGDQRIATISVDGPHTVRRQGTTLEISTEGELGINTSGFSLVRPPRSVDDLRVLGFGKELTVRVNPSIAVDAEVTGNKLTTVGVPRLGSIRVSVGQASLSDVVEVSDALIQAGSASLAGPLSEGRSRIKVESGNLSVRLTHGANVTVRSQTQLGRISWPGDSQATLDEYVVGNGSAQLEIGVVMGRVVIKVDD
ncbi:MAG: hypothetical protein GX440_08245 [Propionibacterium sp.]|uniref:Adhesin domain-containing protein n=1 Tax=Brooklawnia propionicigenes TaxID=3041175 RepID=A0AAN0KAP1_9ACTN|nr:hypothetical protein [Brooklawnia sp. SH051]NLI85369.1 hypothetical protein [Propionibacterium sp.]BEH01445.1 hypothetical protein brsh051_07260 [Brooklawnia sp. SH051]